MRRLDCWTVQPSMLADAAGRCAVDDSHNQNDKLRCNGQLGHRSRQRVGDDVDRSEWQARSLDQRACHFCFTRRDTEVSEVSKKPCNIANSQHRVRINHKSIHSRDEVSNSRERSLLQNIYPMRTMLQRRSGTLARAIAY